VRFEVFTAVRMMMMPTFGRNIPYQSSGLETVCFSETSAPADQSTRRQNPECHQIRNRVPYNVDVFNVVHTVKTFKQKKLYL
jgi:hypothetical protein